MIRIRIALIQKQVNAAKPLLNKLDGSLKKFIKKI